jgi:hypothetical protein
MKRRGAGDEAIAYHTYAAYALPALSGLASALAYEKANAKTCDVGAVKKNSLKRGFIFCAYEYSRRILLSCGAYVCYLRVDKFRGGSKK